MKRGLAWLGGYLLACLVVYLTLPGGALAAQPKAHISGAQARAAIRASVAVDHASRVAFLHCHRDSRIAITCDVEEEDPHGSVTLAWEPEWEGDEAQTTITTFTATATLHGSRVSVS